MDMLLTATVWYLVVSLFSAPGPARGAAEGKPSGHKLPEKALELVDRVFHSVEEVSGHALQLSAVESAEVRAKCMDQWRGDSIIILVPERNDTILGYVVVDNVKGKDQFITYALVVTPDLVVRDFEILAYREPYGYEVTYKSWQEQFFGKRPEDRLRPGREIRNISGATISARAVTLGVNRILCTLRILQGRLPR